MNNIKLCVILSLSVFLFSCSSINTDKHEIPVIDKNPSIVSFPVCYNHGCSIIKNIHVSESTWNTVESLFMNNETAFEERLAVRKAIALFEQEAALHTPVGNDRAKNTIEDLLGQQDCLDESTNTTHFMTLLSNNGLLKWHRVGSRVYRAHFFLDQHYAAQLVQVQTGERYVVDSWHLANGEPAYVQPFNEWARKRSFSPEENPSD